MLPPDLDEPSRSILNVLAVAYDEITATELAKVLSKFGRSPSGRAWNVTNLRPFLDDLEARDLVDARGRISCAGPLREPLTRALVQQGSFAAMARVVQEMIPLHVSYGVSCRGPAEAIREVRFAFYGGTTDAVVAAWEHWVASAGRPLLAIGTSNGGLHTGVQAGLEADWIAALAPPVLDCLAREVFTGGRPDEYPAARMALRPAVAAHVAAGRASEATRAGWVDDLLWCGRILEVEAALGAETSATLILRGRAALMRGAPVDARAAFASAEKLLARETRRRSATLDETTALFQATALLGVGTTEALTAARALPSPQLAFVAEHLLTGATTAPASKDAGGVHALFDGLARVWTNRPIPPALAARLVALEKAAHTAGHTWLETEVAAVRGKAPATYLRALVRPVEAWRLKLDALARLRPTEAAPVPEPPAATARLAWQLSLYGLGGDQLYFTPREQTRSAKGWTGGRPIALKRLHESVAEFDYLTAQDRLILAHLKRESSRDYRGYEDVTYTFLPGATVALIGHPLLSWADSGASVELTRGEPVLLVERRDDALVVRLDPPTSADTLLRRTGPSALELVVLQPVHKRIAAVLEGELRLPITAEAALQPIIAALAGEVAVHTPVQGWGGQSRAADATPRARLAPAGAGLRLRWTVRPLGADGPVCPLGDGQAAVVARIGGAALQASRDLDAERQTMAELLDACPALVAARVEGLDFLLEDEESALALLLELGRLGDRIVVEWPANTPVRRVQEIGAGSFALNVKRDGEWFAASGSLRVDEGLVLELEALLALIDGSPGRFLRLGEGRFVALTEEFRSRLEILRRLGTLQRGRLRFHPVAAPLVDELAGGTGDTAWRTLLARIAAADGLEAEVPSTLTAELRPYQVGGFRWACRLAERGAGACLADDMGVGKTLQALAVLARRAADGPALVIAPTSVCAGWLDEARRFAPTLDIRRFGDGDRDAALAAAGPFTVLVCSFGLLQSEVDRLSAVRWHTLVVDEAQQIKNSTTQRFKAAIRLDAHFRLICSGTPIENHLGELWSLFRFLNPGLLGTESEFKQRFQLPIERDKSMRATTALRRLIRPFILRRTKSEVLSELPPRIEVTMPIELGVEEAALYEAIRRRAVESVADAVDNGPAWRLRVLAEITRLRQAACNARLVLEDSPPASAKLAALADLVDGLRAGGHKALVFSQFVRHLAIVREMLDARGVPYQYLDGSSSPTARAAAVRAFQAGDGDLFLISLRAGGTGLNLTAADYVVHLDPWWNPAVEDQASDRAHRIGQHRPVTIYRMVAVGTVEERIVALHHTKRELAAGLLEGADGRISGEELLALLY